MLSKPRILVAENEGDLAELIRFELEEDFEVYTAQTGDQALLLASRIHPRLILANPQLPSKNSPDYLVKLQSYLNSPKDLILLGTGTAEVSNHMHLTLSKPMSLHRLPEILTDLLDNQQNNQQSGV